DSSRRTGRAPEKHPSSKRTAPPSAGWECSPTRSLAEAAREYHANLPNRRNEALGGDSPSWTESLAALLLRQPLERRLQGENLQQCADEDEQRDHAQDEDGRADGVFLLFL